MTPQEQAAFRAGIEAAAKVVNEQIDRLRKLHSHGNMDAPYIDAALVPLEKVLSDLRALASPPSGMVVVPVEPSEEMLLAWDEGVKQFYAENKVHAASDLDAVRAAGYRAMISVVKDAGA